MVSYATGTPLKYGTITVTEGLSTNLPDLQLNHCPRPVYPLLSHLRYHLSKPRFVVPLHHLPPGEESQYPWTRFERAKHDRHAPVLVDVRHGFGSGACGIDVCGGIRGEDGESG